MKFARSEARKQVECFRADLELLRKMPKTDLHVHLDGSLRLRTLIELAEAQGVKLPSTDEEELLRTVFKPTYDSLEDYLQGFQYTTAVMRDADSIERIAYEFAVDNYSEGVRYFEVRYAPQLHASGDESLTICAVNIAVDRGLRRARDEFNAKLLDDGLDEPMYEYAIILCAMRMIFPGMSRYYDSLMSIHAHEPSRKIVSMASVALVHSAIQSIKSDGIPVVGLDIAGAESGFEAQEHTEAFALAHKHFLNKTVHAGEGYGPESINQAVRDLHADRIGHGFHLFSKDMVKAEQFLGKDGGASFVGNLVKYVCDRRICFEVCLTSNLQTMPGLEIADHAVRKMFDNSVSVTICTDNRLVSRTSTVDELKRAIDAFELTPAQVRDMIINGFKRSFYPGPYDERRAYVRRVIDFYDRTIAEHYVIPEHGAEVKKPCSASGYSC
jgi:adenosine deaminase